MGPMHNDNSSSSKPKPKEAGQLASWVYETSDSNVAFSEKLEKTKWQGPK